MKLQRWCSCGMVLDINVSKARRDQRLITWYDKHSGMGHGDVSAAEAERVRMGFGVAMGREAERGKRHGA